MGDDVCRGLLQFGAGQPLGAGGLRWLRIHLANSWGHGVDKRSFDERDAYVQEHLDMVGAGWRWRWAREAAALPGLRAVGRGPGAQKRRQCCADGSRVARAVIAGISRWGLGSHPDSHPSPAADGPPHRPPACAGAGQRARPAGRRALVDGRREALAGAGSVPGDQRSAGVR
jgi:hypothetical protein